MLERDTKNQVMGGLGIKRKVPSLGRELVKWHEANEEGERGGKDSWGAQVVMYTLLMRRRHPVYLGGHLRRKERLVRNYM